MNAAETLTGSERLARTLAANGTTHVFFIDAVLRRTQIELGTLGVTRVLAHAEKSAAYMADGYARIAGRPGICFAQSVGATNLAAGLQDAYPGRRPVIALTGREPPHYHHRNTYQELPHAPLYASVTKSSADVAEAADLPRLLRQAWREAMTSSPRPLHLDLYGRLAKRDRRRASGQQQFRLRAGLAEHPAPAGQPAGDVRELVRFGPTNFADVARGFGLRAVADRTSFARRLGVRRNRCRGYRHEHRCPGSGTLAAAWSMMQWN